MLLILMHRLNACNALAAGVLWHTPNRPEQLCPLGYLVLYWDSYIGIDTTIHWGLERKARGACC